MSASWEITYNGVTQSADAWGVSNIRRNRKSSETDTVSFNLDGFPFDGSPPFAIWQPLIVLKDGVKWFQGIATKIPRKGTGKSESVVYEISGPWYWLEKTSFQQMWVTNSADGLSSLTTTRSSVILGQSLPGFKINSGQVMLEAMIYCQYAFQGQPFPPVVGTAGKPPSLYSNIPPVLQIGLPPPPNPAYGPLPFLIGRMEPSIITTYTNVRDRSCADIIRLMLKYTPDAVVSVDYTTTPPTINIDRRGSLPLKTINVLNGGPVKVVTGFNPTPRYDLQVPVVVVKFEETQTINNESLDFLTVQSYPPGVPDNLPRAWVQTIDLVGGHTTTQTANIRVKERPVSSGASSGMAWILYKEPWLKLDKKGVPNYLYDYDGIAIAYLNTVIDPNDPLNTDNPLDIPITPGGKGDDCHNLTNELVGGTIAQWLTDSQDVVGAKVTVEVWLSYSGTNANTMALFTYNPDDPTKPTAPGKGYLIRFYPITATNASTTTYSQVTSFQAPEPPPQGFAFYLYECMAPLYFEGELTIIEEDCSDLLPPGCAFNTTDGLADWQSMRSVVLQVEEDIDVGTTVVTFGPPLFLGLDELEELFRLNYGAMPSYKLDQRTTGRTATGAKVDDPSLTTHSASSGPPATVGPATPDYGFIISLRQNPAARPEGTPANWQFYINPNAAVFKTAALNSWIPIDHLGVWGTITPADVQVYIEGTVLNNVVTDINVLSGGKNQGFDSNLPAWDPSGKAWLVSDNAPPPATPKQTTFRVMIGKFTWSNGVPTVSNLVPLNLLLYSQYIATAQASVLALYPSPFAGAKVL